MSLLGRGAFMLGGRLLPWLAKAFGGAGVRGTGNVIGRMGRMARWGASTMAGNPSVLKEVGGQAAQMVPFVGMNYAAEKLLGGGGGQAVPEPAAAAATGASGQFTPYGNPSIYG
jgi:hypothetical protein